VNVVLNAAPRIFARRHQALIAVQLAQQSALNDILTSRIIVQ
jgi:hypothetical protein